MNFFPENSSWIDILLQGLIVVLVVQIFRRIIDILWPSLPPPPPPPRKKPEKRDLTAAELRQYNGENGKEVFVAIQGVIYDVTPGRLYYGPGGPYSMFAGREICRALAKFDTKEEYLDNTNLADLNAVEKDTLHDWKQTFSKYDVIGKLISKKE